MLSTTLPSSALAQTQTRQPATMNVQVTDRSGTPVEGAQVTLSGPSARDGRTLASGGAALQNVSAGTYRVRIEHEAFVTLEKDVVVRAGVAATVEAALSPVKPASDPAPAPEASHVGLVATKPTTLSVPALVEKEFISREPVKETVIGCSGSSETRLIQVREPLTAHTHAEADEMLYLVAGDAVLKVGDAETAVASGWFSIIPRGMPHAITRKGRNPVILLSTVSGAPCIAGKTVTTP
jgi:mannose-6-phosphate isomerase-like protein (cupin superfamily)